MDQEQALAKARQFTDTAFGVEVGKISREFQQKLAVSRNQMAARGILMSGTAVAETARITGERITALLQARLDRRLEGFDLHRVTLTDGMVEELLKELTALRSTWIASAGNAYIHDAVLGRRLVAEGSYRQMVEQHVGLHANEVRTQVERWRLMPRQKEGNTSVNVYHVRGNNNRWLTNSEDHSVNVVTQSNDQIFATLRQEIESGVPHGEEQKEILEKLTALAEAQNTPSFARRYTEFIAVAANHMALLTPFIPALTEMLQKAL